MPWVTVRSYRDPIDAELARSRLEAADIPVRVLDQHLVSIQWLYSRAIGGVKVRVQESDLERAGELLDEDRSGDLAQAPDRACPACGSPDFHRSRVQRRAAALALLTSIPLVAWRRRWICNACGHSWRPRRRARAAVPLETREAEDRVHEARSYPILRVLLAAGLGLAILYYVQLQVRS